MKLDHLVQIIRKMYTRILCPHCKEIFKANTTDIKYFDEKEIVCACKCTKCKSKVTMRAKIKVNAIHKKPIAEQHNSKEPSIQTKERTEKISKKLSPESVRDIAKKIQSFESKNISDLFK